ncbi:hypothetical protein HanHA300_Chr11g0399111 [Helianthus annuus]|nr:hypothetical protein HanHA300_Chr11g0399111 [Helianthus annuus]KAJ0517196.1 hypothetical protein HanHA89_Chr11g0422601 [Helianthus annuus]KAJ0685205.1 hypothetical protein HanLR1_Chr11g0400031 [Helianthus annuus]
MAWIIKQKNLGLVWFHIEDSSYRDTFVVFIELATIVTRPDVKGAIRASNL